MDVSRWVGREAFLCLKTIERTSSELSFTMTGELELFFAGMQKALEIRKCGGRIAWSDMSPAALAASRVGRRISLYTVSTILAEVDWVVRGRPRIRREVEREDWSRRLS